MMIVVLPAHELLKRVEDQRLRRRIQSRRRLVEDQDRGVADDRPRDGDSLLLAAGQRDASLADHRVVAFRQLTNEHVGIRQLGSANDLTARRLGSAVGDVLPHGPAEEQRVL